MATVTINVFFADALHQVIVDTPAAYAGPGALGEAFADGVGAGVAALMQQLHPEVDINPAP